MYDETQPNKETQDLELVARLIKQASFFEGTTDLDRLLNKQLLFLVVAGLKPAAEIDSSHMQKVDTTRFVSVADDPRAVLDFLEGLGLYYHHFPADDSVHVMVAGTQQKLDAALSASPGVEFGRAMGFPETALTETGQDGMLSHEETQQLAMEMYHDPAFAQFLFFSFSQEHARDELRYAKRWYDALREYDLIDSDLSRFTYIVDTSRITMRCLCVDLSELKWGREKVFCRAQPGWREWSRCLCLGSVGWPGWTGIEDLGTLA